VKSIYLDTSAFVKRFSRERGSEVADTLFALCNAGEVKIVISSWVINESIAAIDRKFRRREISIAERDKCISTLIEQADLLAKDGSLAIIPVEQANVNGSLEFVINGHLSADDALHLFSAVISSCKMFVAADKLLVKAATGSNLQGFNIEKNSEQQSLLRVLNG
jgi:predicted nucleic acid-binding protein